MNKDTITNLVAEKARKWQQLSQLLQDQEIVNFLRTQFARGDHAERSEGLPSVLQVAKSPRRKKGAIVKTVASVCQEFPLGTTFTAADIRKRMEGRGFEFTSQDPGISINAALRKLVHKYHKIQVREQGIGRAPSRYEVIPQD